MSRTSSLDVGPIAQAGGTAVARDRHGGKAPHPGLRTPLNRALANRWGLFGLRVGTFVILLLLWQAFASWIIDPFWISSPALVGDRIGQWAVSGYLWQQIGVTLWEAAIGFVVGTVLGALIGAFIGYFRALGRVVEPLLVALYSMPAIALAPLFLLWFGLGLESKVAVAALTVLFIVLFNVYTGVRDVDADLLSTVQVMGARRRHILLKVIGPSILTYVFLGLKVALPFALIGATVAEMISSTHGIGYVMQYSVNIFDTTGVFVGLVVISALSVMLGGLLRALEGRVLRWKRRDN